ncbi:MAG: DUF1552 domain-containing protein [Planctomycetota bacterium]
MTRISRDSRRQFLRGVGASVALPFLPSAMPKALWASGSTSEKPPVRLAFMYAPNGAHMPDWTPSGGGEALQLPPTLEPLNAVREQVLVLSGLALDAGRAHGDGAGDHARSASTFLTGAHPVKTDGKGIRVGVSVDQIAAQHLADRTRFASLQLGSEKGRNAGSCDSGYSCAYSNNISWRTATTPAGKEVDPSQVFDRLFGGADEREVAQSRAKRAAEKQSILDVVLADARRLDRRLSGADRLKLAEYLDGVREVERRIDQNGGDSAEAGGLVRPNGIPAEYHEHVRLLGDLMTLAFQTDATRVCTLMFGNAGSNRTYPQIGVKEGHHSLSHHQNRPEKQSKIAKINRFHVEQLAYLLGRLAETVDGEGSLLDNTLLVYGSGLGDGNRHNHHDLPILLAGGGGGAVAGGRHVRYPRDTPLMNLYVRMLRIAGIRIEAAGDSTGPLGRLT